MKRKHTYQPSGTAMTIIMVLFFVFRTSAQENFQIKWTMDEVLTGVSSHANFSPNDAALLGGSNAYALNGGYGYGGAIVAAYVVRPWPTFFSSGRYVEFSFTANSFKYNISSISFRLRRSPDGPPQVRVRSAMNNFASDLSTHTLTNPSQFYSYSIPTSFNNLTANTFSIRIYGNGPTTIYGTLWFDEIIINGQVLAIILPIDLTYFKAESEEKKVKLSWETALEKNSKEFIVERSADLKDFESIGKLNAAGDATGRLQYEFVDENPFAGVNYYRLRMVDRDGSFSFSKTLDVIREEEALYLQVIPNPASPEKITIMGKDIETDFLMLTNYAGVAIPFLAEPIRANFINLYPEHALHSGLYFLTYQRNRRKEHVKILVP
ncbi:hypothetical protein [Dyadobacter arcticus]|uniref:Por secretion system C-terminal sorting domain-containing protein n=1 Tax=Dyadobacter arcticus TaxID=1078754 RepID=A0ABX0UR57_9BACT|nr:hypothetical protein [Dyadobacter arcticus]NIJ55478.1 hypothetical protein [Dyadobacter arcticus]